MGFVLNAYVYEQGATHSFESMDSLANAQVAIILGAAVTLKGIPSPVLEDRVLAAVALYAHGKVSKILMSGADSSPANNEVDPVRKELVAYGVPAQDIFLDHAGFDTYSTMYRAKHVFNVASAIIVTQEFHLPRAVYIARSLGIDAQGFPADNGSYSIGNYWRELLSRPNAFIEVLVHRVPKYLGPAIPITGDGSST